MDFTQCICEQVLQLFKLGYVLAPCSKVELFASVWWSMGVLLNERLCHHPKVFDAGLGFELLQLTAVSTHQLRDHVELVAVVLELQCPFGLSPGPYNVR